MNVFMIIAFGFTPLESAAARRWRPMARRSKPKRVR